MKSKALSIIVLLLAVVLSGLLFVSHSQEQRQESYEKYEAEQEKRIQELEEEISAIYSRWDEY